MNEILSVLVTAPRAKPTELRNASTAGGSGLSSRLWGLTLTGYAYNKYNERMTVDCTW